MAGYGYMYSGQYSTGNTEEPPQLSTALSYESKHQGRPVFDPNEQGRPLTRYYGHKDDTESHVPQRENVVERVYTSEDGAYKYVVVTRTEPRTLITGSLEGAPDEVSQLYSRILNEVSEPLQKLHVTDGYNDRHARPLSPKQRVENLNNGRNEDRTRPSDNRTGPPSASYWMQMAKFKKQHKPINKSHVSDYKNKDHQQPTKSFAAEPTRILTGPGMARHTSLTTPTNDIDEGMRLMLTATPKSHARPSGVSYVTKDPHFNGPVSSFSSSGPITKNEHAKPSPNADASTTVKNNPPVSTIPNKNSYRYSMDNNELLKPSHHAMTSGIRQGNYPVSSMPNEDSYGEPIKKSGAVKPTHATIASPILPSKQMHVGSSAPIETNPVITARNYGSVDTIDSREAAKLYGTADASSGAHTVYDDDGLPKITSREAAKKYGGKFVS